MVCKLVSCNVVHQFHFFHFFIPSLPNVSTMSFMDSVSVSNFLPWASPYPTNFAARNIVRLCRSFLLHFLIWEITFTEIGSFLKSAFTDTIQATAASQMEKLKAAAHANSDTSVTCDEILRSLEHYLEEIGTRKREENRKKVAAIPYAHALSHSLKTVASN